MRRVVLFIVLFILSVSFVIGVEETSDYSTIRDLFINEEIRTRQELKTYIDGKVDTLNKDFEERGRGFVEEQMNVIQDRAKGLFNIILLKALIGLVVAIILGNAFWYIIKRALLRIKFKKKQILREVED
ncbi:hypothetical protein CCP1ISM_260006 [Azospirillaceae bacterium]